MEVNEHLHVHVHFACDQFLIMYTVHVFHELDSTFMCMTYMYMYYCAQFTCVHVVSNIRANIRGKVHPLEICTRLCVCGCLHELLPEPDVVAGDHSQLTHHALPTAISHRPHLQVHTQKHQPFMLLAAV